MNDVMEGRKFRVQGTLHKLCSCEHLAWEFEKHVQQLKFRRCQIQRPASFRDDARTQIEIQVSKLDFWRPTPVLVVGLPARSAENGGNSSREFARLDRLPHIGVG